MSQVDIYTKRFCPYCVLTKRLLEQKGVLYREFDVSFDDSLRVEMLNRAQRQTVPQIFIGDTHVGGNEELYALERKGELNNLLAAEAA